MGNPTQDAELLVAVRDLVTAINEVSAKVDKLIEMAQEGTE